MKTLITLCTCVLAATAFAADGAQGKGKGEKKADPAAHFQRLDANGDGKLSLEEALTPPTKEGKERSRGDHRENLIREVFPKSDLNGDGFLSLEEFINSRQVMKQVVFGQFDTDDDGQISKDEFMAHVEVRRAERKAEREARRDERKEERQDRKGDGEAKKRDGKGPKGEKGDRPKPPSPDQVFAKMDANGDGVITIDEFKMPHRHHKHKRGKRGAQDAG